MTIGYFDFADQPIAMIHDHANKHRPGTPINPLKPYLYPNAHLGFFFPMSFAELTLPLWLVIRGWKIQESRAQYVAAATSSNA